MIESAAAGGFGTSAGGMACARATSPVIRIKRLKVSASFMTVLRWVVGLFYRAKFISHRNQNREIVVEAFGGRIAVVPVLENNTQRQVAGQGGFRADFCD